MSSLARRLAGAQLRRAPESLAARIHGVLAAWRRRAQGRAQLAQFGERELRDIGLTPADAARECAKPFWRG
jgi:uncharacterized protein YjiS (DUF1127 family)